MVEDKIILITGGTGSFGNAALKYFLSQEPKEIRIFSRDEKKQEDLRLFYDDLKIKFYLGDVRDKNSMYEAVKDVDYVFHAAALKQVPSCEFFPFEAIKTNVIGTENLIKISSELKVKKLVLLSTDKAVYPINAMGISKAMAEKVLIAASRMQNKFDTILCATRYGNVMASRGSVIPKFVNQIENHQPITITDPNMTRFLMSLDESVKLVMQAFAKGNQGDIFVQKSPATKIITLAKALKIIFNSKVDINIIGTRHGEKKHETLVSREEMAFVEDLNEYYRISSDNRDLNYSKFFTEGEPALQNINDYTSENTINLNLEETINLLKNLDFIKEKINA